MNWQELVACALVGTGRQPLPPAGGDSPLADLMSRLDSSAPERQLLAAAAATALYEQAGRLPTKLAAAILTPVEPEELPCCGTRAASHLAAMLAGSYPQVLPKWLELLVASGHSLPPEYLPALLDWGRTAMSFHPPLAALSDRKLAEAAHRPRLLASLGRRGRWLAAQNPSWQNVAPCDNVEATWQTGARAARLLLLQRLRREDPVQARQLLETTWKTEAAKDREEFLATLAHGLSMADEPFLEATLDDRRARHVAAILLGRLASSRLVARMSAHVQPLLTLLPGPRVHIRLPEVCDAAMQRDSIDPKPKGDERAGWLSQMLAAVPPSTWCRLWNCTPGDLVVAAGHSEERMRLLQAWAEAAIAHDEAEWIELLLCRPQMELHEESLFAAASPAGREAFLLELLERENQTWFQSQKCCRYMELLTRYPAAWSPALTRALFTQVRLAPMDPASQAGRLQGFLGAWALYLPCDLYEELAQGWPEESEHWPQWRQSVQQMLACLRFRREMRAALIE